MYLSNAGIMIRANVSGIISDNLTFENMLVMISFFSNWIKRDLNMMIVRRNSVKNSEGVSGVELYIKKSS